MYNAMQPHKIAIVQSHPQYAPRTLINITYSIHIM